MRETHAVNPLETLSIGRAFLKYLIPSLLGMLIMGANFIIDGIMVGNKLGAVALAGVGIAGPAYTLFAAMSLWIGIGGATIYSQAMGEKNYTKAKEVFSQSLTLIFMVTLIIGVTAYIFREPLVYALGANEETYPHAFAYLQIMLLFGFIITVESALSVFVRNDGNPNLAMAAQVTFALSNVLFNSIALYVLDTGVQGVAIGTMTAAFVGLLVLSSHFLKKDTHLKFRKFKWNKKMLMVIILIGFPSFIAEVGMSIFTVAHNVVLERLAGTAGVAAFSTLSYLHGVMLLAFLGLGSAIQPLISYYHGAQQEERKRHTVRIATQAGLVAGVLLLLVTQLWAAPIVKIFGDFPQEVTDLAVNGIKVFSIAYLFVGVNFVMMTYFQSINHVKMAIWVTAAREIILMLIFLAVLPPFFGIQGVWIAVPLSEGIVLLTIYLYYKKYFVHNSVLQGKLIKEQSK
ncbi:MATE family efflux transporter [Paenibacillus tarimensis]|uniref:MATE family efflux transporter n=1 Tax=Paenibacillus tarimensis TaxID=416012 RepID=UPI001EFEF42E|nr:MATE family efflux transporter [Paenibacillus tarimensis]MCF2945768.1 multidrug efflux MATE transporter FepA [Paenibacillus tarimensis]